jgi:DUF4097 and DUF4098 domain-containing protein YvlB
MERSKIMKRAALVLVAATAFPAALAAQNTVDQTRPAAPDGVVEIENQSGTVKVTGWSKHEVHVKGTLDADAELKLGGSDKKTQIEVEVAGNPMSGNNQLDVYVPADSSVSIEGFQATITVSGVSGVVSAETVNGSITHSGPSREVQLQSVNGAVETTRPSGRIQAEAVQGSVTVRDASGELEASTVNGKLVVVGGSFHRAHLESVSGVVRFEGALSAKGTLSVETVSGQVDLFFPAGFAADYRVSTFSGAILNELGPAAGRAAGWGPGKELVFTSGPGGGRVTVQTLSGAVNLHKKP